MCLFCNDTCDVCQHRFTCHVCRRVFDEPLDVFQDNIPVRICLTCKANFIRECVCGIEVFSPQGLEASCADCGECDDCGRNTRTYNIGYRSVCIHCLEDYGICDHCGDYEHIDHISSDDNISICETCARHYVICSDCGNFALTDECTLRFNEYYCSDCLEIIQEIPSDSFEVIKTDRWYGVEIETHSSMYDYADGIWKIETEHCGLEYVSPLLQGDKGLEAIRQLYRDIEPTFSYACGLHVHIDVRDLTENQILDLLKEFKRTKDRWFDYVDSERHNNRYCRNDLPEVRNDESLTDYIGKHKSTRYYWLNVKAIQQHGSIELRLHEATDDIDKVIEWVAMLVNFVSEVVAV